MFLVVMLVCFEFLKYVGEVRVFCEGEVEIFEIEFFVDSCVEFDLMCLYIFEMVMEDDVCGFE